MLVHVWLVARHISLVSLLLDFKVHLWIYFCFIFVMQSKLNPHSRKRNPAVSLTQNSCGCFFKAFLPPKLPTFPPNTTNDLLRCCGEVSWKETNVLSESCDDKRGHRQRYCCRSARLLTFWADFFRQASRSNADMITGPPDASFHDSTALFLKVTWWHMLFWES